MKIVETFPQNGSITAGLDTTIKIVFDNSVDPSTIESGSITVIYKNPNVSIVNTSDITGPGNIFATDNFLSSESSVFLEGDISLDESDDKIVIFKPKNKLLPGTQYDIYISDTITSVNGESLDSMFHSKFSTIEEELAAVDVEVENDLTKVLGTDVQLEATQKFYIENTYPKDQSFLVSNDVRISFNNNIDNNLDVLQYVKIYKQEVMSDLQEEEITSNCTISKIDNKINISITYENNTFYKIYIDKSLKDNNNVSLEKDFELVFLSMLSPYYVSSKLVRLNAGTLLTKHSDMFIAMNIHYYSLQADFMLKSISSLPSDILKFVKQKYTLVYTMESLLLNNMSFEVNSLVNKKLADFSLTINSSNKVQLYNKLLIDIREWKNKFENTVIQLSGNGAFIRNRHSIYSDIGRLWIRDTNFPVINSSSQSSDTIYNIKGFNGNISPYQEVLNV